MKFASDVHVPLRMNCNDNDPLNSHKRHHEVKTSVVMKFKSASSCVKKKLKTNKKTKKQKQTNKQKLSFLLTN